MTNKRSLLVFPLGLSVFATITTEMNVIGVLPQLAERFDRSVSAAGIIVSIYALVVAVAGPFVTLVTSRLNRKTVLLAVLAIMTVSNVAYALSTSFGLTLVFRAIPAVMHATLFAVATVVAVSLSKPEASTKASAQVFAGVAVGLVLGVPITSFLADTLSLGTAFFFGAAVSALAFVGLLVAMPSMPVAAKLSSGAQLRVLKRGQVWWNLAAVTFMFAAMFAVYGYFAEYLQRVTQVSPGTTSVLLVVFGAFGILGNTLFSKFLQRSVARTTLIYPVVFLAVYALIYLLGAQFAPMMILLVVWGTVHSGGLIISQTWLSQATADAPEFGNSLYISFSNVGITFGTLLGGLVISVLGTDQLLLGGIAFLLLAVLAIGTKVLHDARSSRGTLPPPQQQREPAPAAHA
ncbi:MFS transporter [Streptomyces sp. OE57]|uniref:MFS transporter n=1 Tax=Streptomyces lacaronensis TaxID=3379885 RepID=UPI0039B76318